MGKKVKILKRLHVYNSFLLLILKDEKHFYVYYYNQHKLVNLATPK